MSLLRSIGRRVARGLDVFSGIVTHPVTAVTQGVRASTAQFNAASRGANVAQALVNGALVAGAVVGAGAAAAAGVTATARAVGTAIIRNPRTTAAAAIAIPVVASSNRAQQAVSNLPTSVVTLGTNIGRVIDDPSLRNAGQIFTQSPVLAGALVAGTVGASALALAPVISSIRQTDAINDQTQAMQANANAASSSSIPQQIQLIAPPMPAFAAPSPSVEAPIQAAPERTTVKKKKKRSKKKAKKKKKTRRSRKKKKKKSIKRKKNSK